VTELKHECVDTDCLGIDTRLLVVTGSIAIATSNQNRRHERGTLIIWKEEGIYIITVN